LGPPLLDSGIQKATLATVLPSPGSPQITSLFYPKVCLPGLIFLNL
jgi:hypothetical protein